MTILYFAPSDCLPLTTGARLRNYHLARLLAERCKLIYVGLRNPGDVVSDQSPADAAPFRRITLTKDPSYSISKLIRGLVGPVPLPVLNYSSPRVAAGLAAILAAEPIDLVQIEGVHLIGYLPVIRAAPRHPAILADWHNIESEILFRFSQTAPSLGKRLAARRTAQLMVKAETRLLAACDSHTVASERERAQLIRRAPAAEIQVVPNGVDVASYPVLETAPAPAAPRILFVGSMDYHANIDAAVWFVRNVWPLVRSNHPAATFVIVGRNPSAEVRALASASVIVTGMVDDVRPFYSDALAVVAPLRIGSGTRLKILEAMAAGVPVVSTRLGAEGLDVDDETDILLADTPQQTVAALGRLFSDPAARRRLAENGRRLVTRLYDWRIVAGRLHQIHCALLHRTGKTTGP